MGLGRSPRKGIKGTSAIRKVKLSSRSERAQPSAEQSPNMAKAERGAARREEKKQKRKNLRELARAKGGGPDLEAMRALRKRDRPDEDGDGDVRESKPSRLERRSIQAAKRAKKVEEEKKEEKPVDVSEEESESSSSDDEEQQVEIVSKPKTPVKAKDDEADDDDDSDDDEKVDVDEKVDDDESEPGDDSEAADDDSDDEGDDDVEEEDVEDTEERRERTLFIGNVPLSAKRKQLQSLCSQFGKIESIRFRGVIPENPNISKKQALLTGRFHRNVDALEAYVVFKKPKDGDIEGLIQRASKGLNLRLLDGKHLRVNSALEGVRSGRASIFVGNLPLDVTEEMLFKSFEHALKDSGSHVVGARVERDRTTGLGRGFGFVSFNDLLGVKFALASQGKIFVKNRVLRIERADKRLKGNTQAFKNKERLASGRAAIRKHSKAPKQTLSKRQRKQKKKEKNLRAGGRA